MDTEFQADWQPPGAEGTSKIPGVIWNISPSNQGKEQGIVEGFGLCEGRWVVKVKKHI